MSKDLVEHPANPVGDDPNKNNEKIIGGAWLFANRSAEKIDFDFGTSGQEEPDATKKHPGEGNNK